MDKEEKRLSNEELHTLKNLWKEGFSYQVSFINGMLVSRLIGELLSRELGKTQLMCALSGLSYVMDELLDVFGNCRDDSEKEEVVLNILRDCRRFEKSFKKSVREKVTQNG